MVSFLKQNDMQTQKFSWLQRARSFGFAFDGIRTFFKTQHNAIIHAVATIAVVVTGLSLHLAATEWLFITIVTGMVWAAELFNTAIEKLCDMVSPQRNPTIKFIKDVAAAAVLVTAIAAVVTGCIIFLPKLF
jgi:diacylglycerol kinase